MFSCVFCWSCVCIHEGRCKCERNSAGQRFIVDCVDRTGAVSILYFCLYNLK